MYECSHCKIRFSKRERSQLPTKPVDPDDEDSPMETACPECERRLFTDKWGVKDTVTVHTIDGELDVCVSTVHLVIAHGMNQNLYYETLISYDNTDEIIDRYTNQADAVKAHNTICDKLADGDFMMRDTDDGVEISSLVVKQ